MGCLFTSFSEASKFNSETNIDHISHDLRQSWSSSASFTSSTESQWYVHSSYQLKNNEKYCWLGVYATICIRTLSSLCYISYWLRWTVIPDCRFTSLRLILAYLSLWVLWVLINGIDKMKQRKTCARTVTRVIVRCAIAEVTKSSNTNHGTTTARLRSCGSNRHINFTKWLFIKNETINRIAPPGASFM